MGWQAMDKLHVEKDDGSFVDLSVSDLSEDDANWLEAARKRPWAMKTEVIEPGAADDDESDQVAEADAEAEADSPQ
jgi:site-specific recombinase